MSQQESNVVSWPFLRTPMFWLGVLFRGFDRLAQFHTPVVMALLI